jgi:hypothetical protein
MTQHPHPDPCSLRPDLSRLMRMERKQALDFAYGADQKGRIIWTTLQKASPLLIMDGESSEYDALCIALLTQLYTKKKSRLKVIFLEQHHTISQPFAPDPRTTVRHIQTDRLTEEISSIALPLERHNLFRLERPPQLVVVEAEILRDNQRGLQAMKPLFERAVEHGIFILIAAPHYEPFLQAYLPFCHLVVTRLIGNQSSHPPPWLAFYQEGGTISTLPFFAPCVDHDAVPALLSVFNTHEDPGSGKRSKANRTRTEGF